MQQFSSGQTLLIDADDTLWENNIYFEHAIARFTEYLNHNALSPAQVRDVLNAIEHETILAHGYGFSSFTNALFRCYERLTGSQLTESDLQTIRSYTKAIYEHPIELLTGVDETLAELAQRHHLILMTKGTRSEQLRKLNRSGVAKHFAKVEVVREKDAATYRNVMLRHALQPQSSWMIGNSIKSDINPALAANLNAIFLFHKDTWVLEHAEISTVPAGLHLFELESFPNLRDIF